MYLSHAVLRQTVEPSCLRAIFPPLCTIARLYCQCMLASLSPMRPWAPLGCLAAEAPGLASDLANSRTLGRVLGDQTQGQPTCTQRGLCSPIFQHPHFQRHPGSSPFVTPRLPVSHIQGAAEQTGSSLNWKTALPKPASPSQGERIRDPKGSGALQAPWIDASEPYS